MNVNIIISKQKEGRREKGDDECGRIISRLLLLDVLLLLILDVICLKFAAS